MTTSLDRVLDGLDDQQRAAAMHRRGPALIVAGAGAGKTTTLVRRIAALLADGAPPEGILVLSFTRASAKSILDRARSFDRRAIDVVGGTFHSVGSRIVREYHSLFGISRDFTLLDPDDSENLVKRIASDIPTARHRPTARSLVKMISFARNTQRNLSEIITERYPKQVESIEWIESVAERYTEEKHRQQILDYDDLLEFWARLCEHPIAGEAIRSRFSHVIIDEHQDSNAIQLRILYALGGECEGDRSITAVGDPSQSIYAFRGAAPGTMFDFLRHWPTTTTYLIERNYRSVPEVVAAADRIDRSMNERFERKLVSTRESIGSNIVMNTVPGPEEEAEIVSNLVLDKVEEGIPLHEQAILVRSMKKVRGIELRLKEKGIPYKVVGGIKIHEAAHVKDILAPLKIAANPMDEGSWIRLISLFPGIGPKTAGKIAEACSSGDLDQSIAQLRDIALKKPPLVAAVAALEATTFDAPNEALSGVFSSLARIMKEKDSFQDDWDSRKKDIEAIVDLSASYESIAHFLETITIDVALDKQVDERGARDDERPLTLSTIHGSKGLEWKFVCIPSFVQGHLPSAFAETADDMDEERRLFYVASTRAKDELVFFKPATTMVKGMLMSAAGSPFEDILEGLTRKVSLGMRPVGLKQALKIPQGVRINGWG